MREMREMGEVHSVDVDGGLGRDEENEMTHRGAKDQDEGN